MAMNGGLKRWLFTQEFRFRLGQSFLTFVNFSLLVTAASEKLEHLTGLERTRYLLVTLVPLAFVCVWVIGWVMDRLVKAPQAQAAIGAERTEWVQELLNRLSRLEESVNKPYPTVKSNPSRKQRKGLRNKVFQENKKAAEDRRKKRI